MKLDACHFLVVEKGEPYQSGERIQLNQSDTIIGRAGKVDKPYIAFESLYVSRKHALVTMTGESFMITDLQSKHGTQINGADLEPNRQIEIYNGDLISLAKGMVTMSYKVLADFDDRTMTLTNIFRNQSEGLVINLERREVYVEGDLLSFSGKEMDLLLMLFRNKNRAVGYDEIKIELWPERLLEDYAVPDVGNDEITALVYRLRKRLGHYGQKIVTVARYGVLLDV